jgi:LPS-assembly lipoprotein
VRCARTLLALLLLAPLLAACGFHLRGAGGLPPEMAQTQLVVEDPYSTLARRLRTLLEQSGVEIVAGGAATAVLEIPQNRVTTDVLTIADNARVREYRVSHVVQFRLTDAAGRELMPLQTLRQAREISFDEQKILASSREQEYLREDLAEDLARLIVNRLESVAAGPG